MKECIFAGIDAGGTEFKCIVGTGPNDIRAFQKIPVTTPEQTLPLCVEFFKQAISEHGELSSIGVASFGPIDLHLASPSYGSITSTPKPHWANTPIVSVFEKALGVPVVFDTDVNGALLGEVRWGAAQGLNSVVYVTVGTGVGAAVMMNGRLVYGAMHVEAGHMLVPKFKGDSFDGVCPFHGDCLEGLVSGPAIAKRWQQPSELLASSHAAWELEAHYLGAMCVNLSLAYSPQRIILGGGVMGQESLLERVRQAYSSQINGYLGGESSSVDSYIVDPELGAKAGAVGSLVLAQRLIGDA